MGPPVVKDVVEDLEEYLENVGYLKGATASSLGGIWAYVLIQGGGISAK